MTARDDGEGTSPGEGGGRVARVGDDPLVLTFGTVTIGLLVGVFIGLVAWNLLATNEPLRADDGISQDLDQLSAQVVAMDALLEQVERGADARSWELGSNAEQLASIRASIDELDARLSEARDELEGRSASLGTASEDLSDMRGELLDVRMRLVDLQTEIYDLLARIIAGEGWPGGGGGGDGNATVPENATLLPSPHLTHWRSRLLVFSCDICHDVEPAGEVIVSGSRMYWNGSLDEPGFNTVIDLNAECVECHGQFPVTGMQPSYKDASCVACHEDWADRMTATYVRKSAVTEDDCLTCHGGPNAFIDEPEHYGPPP